jgi:hypothetical protein
MYSDAVLTGPACQSSALDSSEGTVTLRHKFGQMCAGRAVDAEMARSTRSPAEIDEGYLVGRHLLGKDGPLASFPC